MVRFFWKKTIDRSKGMVNTPNMKDTTTGDFSFKENPIDDYFLKTFIRLLDNLSDPNYRDAMEKVYEICSKQNPNLN